MNSLTIDDMVQAGVHMGHKAFLGHPKMFPYVYAKKRGVHILDMRKSLFFMKKAKDFLQRLGSEKKRILFVGTKPCVSYIVQEAAKSCGQHYVTHRWLGGMLTNMRVVRKSIKTLHGLRKLVESEDYASYSKKERSGFQRQLKRLEVFFGGVEHMNGLPDAVVVMDIKKDRVALAEAKKLGVPVIAIVDSNVNPDGIQYIIPGNDDSVRSVSLYCKEFSVAILEGMDSGDGKSESEESRQSGQKKYNINL